MKIDYKKLVPAVLIPLLLGAAVGLLSGAGDVYGTFEKPPLSPPGWLFPVAWSALYILMGVAYYLARRAGVSPWLYAAQLAVNLIWPLIFFNLKAYGFAFVWLVLLLVLVLFTMLSFFRAERRAGWLMLPYFLWLCFAGYLNLGVYILN